MSSSKPGAQSVSVLPPELRPQDHRLEMGLQELSRTTEWRSLQPYLKRILTSYLGGGMPEDEGNWELSVARFYVGQEKEKIAAHADRLSKDPQIIRVLAIQRGEI
jgi:hypothetical protein